jgi:CRISPR-associated endonuclease Cas1
MSVTNNIHVAAVSAGKPRNGRTKSKPSASSVRVIREGRALRSEQIDDILGAIEAGFADDPAGPSVAVVLGEGVRVRVYNGQLQVGDGLGWNRRVRNWPKAGSGLRRLVVGAQSGMITLDAIAWCQALGVAIVVVDQDGEVVLSPGSYGHDDARLRRVQGTASDELAVSIAIGLIGAKILGQASVAAASLDRPDVAETLAHIAAALDDAASIDEVRQLEATAAACYFGAWVDHPTAAPRFTVADTKRVPTHWCHYDGRRSLLTKGNSNRKAERPTNAVLNYLYRIAAIEARLACVAVGLDPGLGVLHMDASGRDSLVLDVIEPVRPQVERFVIDLMAEATFTRKDFIERSDGSVRIGPALAQRLAATMPIWAREVAPYAEQVAHTFGRVVAGKWSRGGGRGQGPKGRSNTEGSSLGSCAGGGTAHRRRTRTARLRSLYRLRQYFGAAAALALFDLLGEAAGSSSRCSPAPWEGYRQSSSGAGAVATGERGHHCGPGGLPKSHTAQTGVDQARRHHDCHGLHEVDGLVV